MNDSTVFVGIDYATAFVQICILDEQGNQLANHRCDNHWEQIAKRVAYHGTRVRAGIEACNGASDLAEEMLQKAGWSIDLAHPGYVQRMKQSPDKSDYSDARMLADLVRVGYLPKVWLPPLFIRELRRLMRQRQDLVKRRKTIKQRMSSLLRDHRCIPPQRVHPYTKRWWLWVEQLELPTTSRWILQRMKMNLHLVQLEILETEKYIKEVTLQDPYVQSLMAIPGIGLVTACWIRAEIGDPTRFRTGKQMARFCGLTPRNASSGLRQADAGLVYAANPEFRSILIEAAHRLMRNTPRWEELAGNLRLKGKPGSVVSAAIGNRWIRSLYHDLVRIHLDLQTAGS